MARLPGHPGVGFVGNTQVLDVRLLLALPVDEQLAAAHLERVTGHADQAFHQLEVGIVMGIEDEDVPAFGAGVAWNPHACPRDPRSERHAVDHEEVAHEQGVLHGPGRDHEGLDQEGTQEEEERRGDHERLQELEEAPLLLLALRALLLRAVRPVVTPTFAGGATELTLSILLSGFLGHPAIS